MCGPPSHQYTWQDYLAVEADASVRHEFFDGRIFALLVGTPAHAQLAVNVASELKALARGSSCRVYSSDLRVRVEETGLGTYPDVTVVCGELRFDPTSPRTTVVNPTLVVEILSDSTEAWDRNAKYDHFRRIPSLMEYVLVSHRERLIEVFRRGESDAWDRWEARQGAAAELKALGGHLEVDSVYEGVELHLG